MRKLMILFAALVALCSLSPLAYAAETSGSDPVEYTESQQNVYLAQGANLYLGPDTSYDVYATAPKKYNKKVIISGIYATGWVRYKDTDTDLWMYVAPEDLIWNEVDAYTYAEYAEDLQQAEAEKQEAAQESKEAEIKKSNKQYIVRSIILGIVGVFLFFLGSHLSESGKMWTFIAGIGMVCMFVPMIDGAVGGINFVYSPFVSLGGLIGSFAVILLVMFMHGLVE